MGNRKTQQHKATTANQNTEKDNQARRKTPTKNAHETANDRPQNPWNYGSLHSTSMRGNARAHLPAHASKPPGAQPQLHKHCTGTRIPYETLDATALLHSQPQGKTAMHYVALH